MDMRQNLIITMAMLCLSLSSVAQNIRTVLSANIDGYKRDMVYFDCVQTPFIKQEFHTNPGEEHTYAFDTDRMVSMIINGRSMVLLTPGDSLHVDVKYLGKQVKSLEFSGSQRAVENNKLYAAFNDYKKEIRYKTQMLACIVVDVKPVDRLNDSKKLLEKTHQLVNDAKGKVSPEVADYVMAEAEGLAYSSFVEYPTMYEETRKLPLAQQGIGDYWNVLKDVKLRDDFASLSSPDYCSFLLLNMAYEKAKAAQGKSEKYVRPNDLESMFAELASFYDGNRRDVVLYSVLSNFIQGGKDIDRVEPLLKTYKEKYCTDKRYAEILDALMQ